MKRDIGHIDNNSGQGAEYLRATGGPVRKSIWIYRARDKTLTEFHAQGNRTILHITHSLEEALKAQNLILLKHGRIKFSDSVTEFLARERWLEDYGITPPPLQQLNRDLRAHGYAIPPEITSVPELKSLLLKMKAENGHTSD